VLFLGMGASLCSSISGSVLLQTHARPSFSVDAGEWLHYGIQHGMTPLSRFCSRPQARARSWLNCSNAGAGRALALICNNSASTCWGLAENKLPILAGPEYGNATKTYTNCHRRRHHRCFGDSWPSLAEDAESAWRRSSPPILIASSAMRAGLEEFCRGAANTEIIGRGAAYGGAIMSALCIREMTGHRAAAHTGAGFRHGPNLDVDASHLAIIFALGRVAELGVKLPRNATTRRQGCACFRTRTASQQRLLFPFGLMQCRSRGRGLPQSWFRRR
jgi:glucosamine--fructose-6-phosphate aminotransferase (isomerizing)